SSYQQGTVSDRIAALCLSQSTDAACAVRHLDNPAAEPDRAMDRGRGCVDSVGRPAARLSTQRPAILFLRWYIRAVQQNLGPTRGSRQCEPGQALRHDKRDRYWQ